MSKWRPTLDSCFYVIPDIHGQLYNLRLATDRICPLRRTDGVYDKLLFLGDYIDRDINSHLVVDHLISLKRRYKDQVILLKGNHEQMLLDALEPSVNSDNYLLWMRNGGSETLSGYADRLGRSVDNPFTIARQRVIDYIPAHHLEFYKTLLPSYETDEYIFVHGGMDPLRSVARQPEAELIWDRSLHEFVTKVLGFKEPPWKKTIVCGHNGNAYGTPTIRSKYLMLDTSQLSQVMIVELNTMECCVAKKGNKHVVKFQLEEM